jgi:hypothetical protein
MRRSAGLIQESAFSLVLAPFDLFFLSRRIGYKTNPKTTTSSTTMTAIRLPIIPSPAPGPRYACAGAAIKKHNNPNSAVKDTSQTKPVLFASDDLLRDCNMVAQFPFRTLEFIMKSQQ